MPSLFQCGTTNASSVTLPATPNVTGSGVDDDPTAPAPAPIAYQHDSRLGVCKAPPTEHGTVQFLEGTGVWTSLACLLSPADHFSVYDRAESFLQDNLTKIIVIGGQSG